MRIGSVVSAYFQTCSMLLSNAKLRALMLRPFLAGLAVYLVSLGIGLYFFGEIRAVIDPELQNWVRLIVNPLIWIATLLIVLFGSVVLVVILTLSLLGILQVPLAKEVLQLKGFQLPIESGSVRGFSASLVWEGAKLIVVILIGIIAVLLGIFPLLLPISIILSGWIIGFESFDVALEAGGKTVTQRIKLILKNSPVILAVGLGGLVFALIPFAAIILPSVSVGCMAILMAEGKCRLGQESQVEGP